MNENQFLNKYVPLIGTKVNDSVFNTEKLTKTAVLNKICDLFYIPALEPLYKRHAYVKILRVLTKLLNISSDILGFTLTKEWNTLDKLTHSIGNDKIGNDTLCISVNTGILCYMGITGNCKNCSICYAKNSNKMYSMEFLKNLICNIVVLKVMTGSLSFHDMIKNTIYSINACYSKPALKRLFFLRFNVNGDILSNDMLKLVNNTAYYLKMVFNIKIAYSYTHNQALDLKLADNIVFNASDFLYPGIKTCHSMELFNIEMLTSDDFILCNGNCTNCSYCKNQYDCRHVIFLYHGGIYKGLEQLNDYLISFLEYNKASDYLTFIRCLAGY